HSIDDDHSIGDDHSIDGDRSIDGDHSIDDDRSIDDDHSIFTPLSVDATSSSAFELNEWFNCLFDPTDGASETSAELKPDTACAPSALLPAALPPVMPRIDADHVDAAPAPIGRQPSSTSSSFSS